MTINNHIEGIFRLTAPLHCASPDRSLAAADNETPTMQQRLVAANGLMRIPFFPGNDLRGRLRRKAAAHVLDHICATAKVTPQLYAGLNAGANSAQPDSAPETIEETLRARRNVYMGLFGGGARMLRSRFSVNDLVPVISATIEAHMVPARFGESDGQNFLPMSGSASGPRAVEGWQLVETRQVLRVDDVMRVMRPDEMTRYITDAERTVTALQAGVIAGKESRKASKAQAEAGTIRGTDVVKKQDIGNVTTFQVVPAGTPMYCRLDFADDISDAQVGLMLLSLRDLVDEQRLGGWCRAGLGRFTADLMLVRGGERMPVFAASAAADGAELSAAVAATFIPAAKAEISLLTAEAMNAFYEVRAGKAEAVAA